MLSVYLALHWLFSLSYSVTFFFFLWPSPIFILLQINTHQCLLVPSLVLFPPKRYMLGVYFTDSLHFLLIIVLVWQVFPSALFFFILLQINESMSLVHYRRTTEWQTSRSISKIFSHLYDNRRKYEEKYFFVLREEQFFVLCHFDTCHELVCARKVVTRSLTRFLLVYVIHRNMWKKRHKVIWTCVCKQETKRDLRRKTLFWTRHMTRTTSVSRMTKYISGLVVRCVVISKSRLWQHTLLFNSWPCHCPSCPPSPPSCLPQRVSEGTRWRFGSRKEPGDVPNWNSFFYSSQHKIEERKLSKDSKNRFSKKWQENTFFRCSSRLSFGSSPVVVVTGVFRVCFFTDSCSSTLNIFLDASFATWWVCMFEFHKLPYSS